METRRFDIDKVKYSPWIHPVEELVYDKKIRTWCGLPYYAHPKGCPNYLSGKEKCPEAAPYVDGFFDLSKQLYFVVEIFYLWKHQERMKLLHPKWTERQTRNCLYWQAKPRNRLADKADAAMVNFGVDAYCTLPESLGVHVYLTCRRSGIYLEKIRHLQNVKFIALVGNKGAAWTKNF